MQIHYLKIFETNYIWLLQVDSSIIVIDPGSSQVVSDYITAKKLNLIAILLTHAHLDHAGGVDELVNLYNIPVYGSPLIIDNQCVATKIIALKEYQNLELFPDIQIKPIYTPGHTFDSISYLVNANNREYLFCGDTLFAGGCGRVFTNDYNLMFASLNKIKELNNNLEIYPAHEYTLSNLYFARFLEPDNQDILARIRIEEDKGNSVGITLPTNLKIEKLTNPFLRVNELKQIAADLSGNTINIELEGFIGLRNLKDNFVG